MLSAAESFATGSVEWHPGLGGYHFEDDEFVSDFQDLMPGETETLSETRVWDFDQETTPVTWVNHSLTACNYLEKPDATPEETSGSPLGTEGGVANAPSAENSGARFSSGHGPGEHSMQDPHGQTRNFPVQNAGNDVVANNQNGVRDTIQAIQQRTAPGTERGGVIIQPLVPSDPNVQEGPLARMGPFALEVENPQSGQHWSLDEATMRQTVADFLGVDVKNVDKHMTVLGEFHTHPASSGIDIKGDPISAMPANNYPSGADMMTSGRGGKFYTVTPDHIYMTNRGPKGHFRTDLIFCGGR